MNYVLIIGAGAAGLAAARDIAAARVPVRVVEARPRVGGRIHTELADGLRIPIELGAEFVHGKHPALIKIIEDTGIPYCDVTTRYWSLDKGKLQNTHQYWNKLTALMDLMSYEQPDQTFARFLQSLPDNEESRLAKTGARDYIQGFHASNIERIGVHGLKKSNEAEDEIDGRKSFRLTGGYDLVVQALYRDAITNGADIKLNTIVKKIRWTDEGVDVVCATADEESTLSAQRCVITLPVGVLQAESAELGGVAFEPALPDEKRKAIKGIEMGKAIRIVMQFRERFWEDIQLPATSGTEDLSEMSFLHNTAAQLPTLWTQLPLRAPVLVAWTGGPNAEHLATLPADEFLNAALSSVSDTLRVDESRLRNLLVSAHSHNWNADPFTRGTYSYLPVNGLELQRSLARPIDDVLFFAGEATSVGYVGTVHGAIESGLRAAREILSTL
jgi:monoamine oxidase